MKGLVKVELEDKTFRIAPFRENSPLKHPEWHVLTTDHTYFPVCPLCCFIVISMDLESENKR